MLQQIGTSATSADAAADAVGAAMDSASDDVVVAAAVDSVEVDAVVTDTVAVDVNVVTTEEGQSKMPEHSKT